MRDSFASPINDFTPRDERAANSNRRGKKPVAFWRRIIGADGRLRATLLGGFAAALAIGVSVNALFLQEGRHPAPMFQGSVPKQEPSPRTPLPPARPASIDAKTEAQTQEASKLDNAKPDEKPVDAIAQLLKGSAPKKADAEAHDKAILFSQRALAKLGYALHQDGVFGGATREAIEKFERANGMPVKGELTPKILRLLSERSGIAYR